MRLTSCTLAALLCHFSPLLFLGAWKAGKRITEPHTRLHLVPAGYQRAPTAADGDDAAQPPRAASPQPPAAADPAYLRVLRAVCGALAVFCGLLLFVRLTSLDGFVPGTLPAACKQSKARGGRRHPCPGFPLE